MRKVFADTGYWIALLNPRDSLNEKARSVSEQIAPVFTITSEMVLAELFDALAGEGEHLRMAAVDLNKKLSNASNCEIVPQTSIIFREAARRYEERVDKGWGLTDCASFLIMEEKGVTEALTHDRHFVQAGFQALLKDDDQ